MNRMLSTLGEALFLAVAMLVATLLVVAAPRAPWTAVAAPLLLVLALTGADLVHRRRSGRGSWPSPSVLLVSAGILVACGIVASRNLESLAEMFPVLGSCAAVPALLRHERARASCRRDAGLASGQ